MGKWVPDEPTEEMMEVALHGVTNLRDVYEFMLAAAPSPWQPIGHEQRGGPRIIAIGRDDYGKGQWRLGTPWWNLESGPAGMWTGGPFMSSCQPTHFMQTPELPPLPNQNKKES